MRSLLAAADQDLPPPRRPRHGRHGGADPDQERPGRQRDGAGQGPRRQGPRGGRRPRRHLGGPPGPGAAWPWRSSTRTCRGRTRSTGCRDDVQVTAADLLAVPDGHRSPRRACAPTSTWASVPGSLAARQRLRADLQPDGRRRHRRDLAARRSGSGSASPAACSTDGRKVTPELFRAVLGEELDKIRGSIGRRRALRRAASYRTSRASLIDDIVASDEFTEFLTLPAYDDAAVESVTRSPALPTIVSRDIARRVTTRMPLTEIDNDRRACPIDEELRIAGGPTPRWDGIRRDYTAEDVVRLRGSMSRRAHAWRGSGPRGCGGCSRRALRPRPRGAHRQPGRADGRGRAEGDLRQRLAGGRRRQPRRPDVSRPEPLSGRQRARRWCARINNALHRADQIDIAEGRSDQRLLPARSWPTPRPASAACSTPSN